MLNIGGELAFILQDIDYSSKTDLIDKLRALRNGLKDYDKEEQRKIRPILNVSIQQAYHLSEWEIMRYKKFCDYRSENNAKSEQETTNWS